MSYYYVELVRKDGKVIRVVFDHEPTVKDLQKSISKSLYDFWISGLPFPVNGEEKMPLIIKTEEFPNGCVHCPDSDYKSIMVPEQLIAEKMLPEWIPVIINAYEEYKKKE